MTLKKCLCFDEGAKNVRYSYITLSLNYLIDRSIQHCRGFLDESNQADHNKSVEGMLYIHFDLLAQLSY